MKSLTLALPALINCDNISCQMNNFSWGRLDLIYFATRVTCLGKEQKPRNREGCAKRRRITSGSRLILMQMSYHRTRANLSLGVWLFNIWKSKDECHHLLRCSFLFCHWLRKIIINKIKGRISRRRRRRRRNEYVYVQYAHNDTFVFSLSFSSFVPLPWLLLLLLLRSDH